MTKILYVINPLAGGRNKGSLCGQIRELSGEKEVEADFYETTGEEDYEKILALLRKEEIQRVIVGGGDGTVKLAGECCMKTETELGIIPLGSANGLATELGIPFQPMRALDVALGHTLRPIDALEINGDYCFHLADLGVNAALIEQYEQSNVRGFAGYALSALRGNFRMIEPFEVTVKAGEELFKRETYEVFITNCRQFGTGISINPEGILDDGRFEICLLQKPRITDAMVRLFSDEAEENEGIYRVVSAQNAEITCSRPVRFQADGEYLGKKEKLQIGNLRKALKVVVPVNR